MFRYGTYYSINRGHPDNDGLHALYLCPPSKPASRYRLIDLSEGLQNATIVNAPPLIRGPGGQMGLTFNGSNQYAIASVPVSDPKGMTVALWVKTTYSNPSSRYMWSWGGFDNGGRFDNSSFTAFFASITATLVNDGKWHRLVFTKFGDRSCAYLDGVLQDAITVAYSLTSAISFTLGGGSGATDFFIGSIAGFRLHSGVGFDSSWVARDYIYSLDPQSDPRLDSFSRLGRQNMFSLAWTKV